MLLTWVALLAVGWAAVWLLDRLLKSASSTRRVYARLITAQGMSLSPCKLQWYTTSLNQCFIWCGSRSCLQQFLQRWFDMGIVFGIVAMVASTGLLMSTLINQLFRRQPAEEQLLTPVVPGVNLPSSDLGYFGITLFVSAVLHEMGHAVAAVREGVRMNGFGVFLMVVYPGAFVDLNTESLMAASPWKRLRIFCAGVWHNFIIVLVAMVIIVLMPYLLSPFYTLGQGVMVSKVLAAKTAQGGGSSTDLQLGDCIVAIDNCTVKDASDWLHCLGLTAKLPSPGYCVQLNAFEVGDLTEAVAHVKSSTGDSYCCPQNSSTHVCFSSAANKLSAHDLLSQDLLCLRARRVCSSTLFCGVDSDCGGGAGVRCLVPYLGTDTLVMRLVKVTRTVNDQLQEPVLFLGHPQELYYSVEVTDLLPRDALYSLHWPVMLRRLCQYAISLSGALAVLNVVPCYALDGQWILLAISEIAQSKLMLSSESCDTVCSLALLLGSLLLAANIAVAMSSVLL